MDENKDRTELMPNEPSAEAVTTEAPVETPELPAEQPEDQNSAPETAEVPAGDSLKVMLKAAGTTATVRVTAADIRTIVAKVENLRYERVPGALQVGFDVGESLAGAGYQVQLVGVSGKVLASARGKSAAGSNTLALKAPKPGLYLLRVSVAGNQAARKVAISR